MALTVTLTDTGSAGNLRWSRGTIAFDSSYASNGESFTPEDIALKTIDHVTIHPNSGYVFEYDYSNEKVIAFSPDIASTNLTYAQATVSVQDDDSAASNGTALVVVPIAGSSTLGYFASTTAGSANTYFAAGNGGPTFEVFDSDTPGGAALHFDDDGATEDLRVVADLSSLTASHDMFVMGSSGQMFRIVHDGSATSTGTDLYIDDDASNDYEKLLSVTANNANADWSTDDTVGASITNITVDPSQAALSEVASGTDLSSALTAVRFMAWGT